MVLFEKKHNPTHSVLLQNPQKGVASWHAAMQQSHISDT